MSFNSGIDIAQFEMNGCLVEPSLNRIIKGNDISNIEPRVMAVLLVLVEKAGELVLREEIIDRVWSDRAVSDSSLNRNIAQLRRIFDWDNEATSCIRTIPKKGYLLDAKLCREQSSMSINAIDEQLAKEQAVNDQTINLTNDSLFEKFKRKPFAYLWIIAPLLITSLSLILLATETMIFRSMTGLPKLGIVVEIDDQSEAGFQLAEQIKENIILELTHAKLVKVKSLSTKVRNFDEPSRKVVNYDTNVDYLMKVQLHNSELNEMKMSFYLFDVENELFLWSKRSDWLLNESQRNEEMIKQTTVSLSEFMGWPMEKLNQSESEFEYSATQNITFAPNDQTRAFCLNGLNDYVEVKHVPGIDVGTNNFSISAWIKTSTSNIAVIVDKRVENKSGNVKGYVLHLFKGFLGVQLADGGGSWRCVKESKLSSCTNYLSNYFIADGKWHFVNVTVDRLNTRGMKLYIDGDLHQVFDPSFRSGSLSNSSPLRIGSRSSSVSGLFPGNIGEVSIHNYVLSQEDVSALYNKGVARECELHDES